MSDILITHAENFSPEARRLLEGAGHRLWRYPQDCDPLRSATCEALWVRLERFSAYDLAYFTSLKVLATNCTGTDHLPLEECARRNIRVVSLQDCREEMPSVHSTAELTVLLILELLRNVGGAAAHVNAGGWDRWQFVGRELRGKRVAIIGYGRVGQQVGELLTAFGCKVLRFNEGWEASLALVGRADIITCHASLNDTSRGMFNAERFAQMKHGAYFINTARGAIVDEGALLGALESGHLAGAALDVVQDEPYVNPALVEFARREPGRLIITPHCAGATVEGLHATELMIARKLVEIFAEPVADPRFLNGPIPD